MKFRTGLLFGLAVILSGVVGYRLGQWNTALSIKNWKPALIKNQGPAMNSSAANVDFTLFWTVWDKVNAMYVDKSKLDAKKMVDGAIEGMVASIGDPYTMYLPVTQNKETKEDLGGAFDGVGIQLGYKDQRLAVMSPLDGSPAAKAGVKAGDLILKIVDQKNKVEKLTNGMTTFDAMKLIRGIKGTEVTLTLGREGQEKPFDVTLVRDTIVVKSVTLSFEDSSKGKKIAWLKLSRFGDRTQDEWNEAVASIVSSDAKGVVLDLRNNPGGYLEGAVYIAGEFLSPGDLVVTQQYGDGSKIENNVKRNGRILNLPVVVLVNKGSASAAEILSGALQDHKRAKVLGEQSFGKGSVQQPEDFADGSGIHVTVAKWLRPSGDWIDHKGVTPDTIVKGQEKETDPDEQLNKALELL